MKITFADGQYDDCGDKYDERITLFFNGTFAVLVTRQELDDMIANLQKIKIELGSEKKVGV